MRADLPRVAQQVVDAIRAEVPSYADPFRGEMGRTIENAVAAGPRRLPRDRLGQTEGSASFGQVSEAAYALGRGEARSGRTMEALLSAYRVGARVAWRDMSELGGAAPGCRRRRSPLRRAGLRLHRRALRGQRRRPRRRAGHGRPGAPALPRAPTQALLRGAPPDALRPPPSGPSGRRRALLTAVVLPDGPGPRRAGASSTPTRCSPTEQVPGLEEHPDLTVLLVPSSTGRPRGAPAAPLQGREAVVGPSAALAPGRRVLRPGAAGRRPGPRTARPGTGWTPRSTCRS